MELGEIGYFSKTHGIKGQLILKCDRDFYFEEAKALFIERSGSKAPYFVSEIKETNDSLIVLLEEVNSVEQAKLLVGKKVFADASLFDEEDKQDNWIGYELVDEERGSLGKIIEVSDNGAQLLVSVLYKEKEVILPLTDDFIESIDDSAKIIKFKAPVGLIDIYLNE
jgi:16S rRNA processing protein RimM